MKIGNFQDAKKSPIFVHAQKATPRTRIAEQIKIRKKVEIKIKYKFIAIPLVSLLLRPIPTPAFQFL